MIVEINAGFETQDGAERVSAYPEQRLCPHVGQAVPDFVLRAGQAGHGCGRRLQA